LKSTNSVSQLVLAYPPLKPICSHFLTVGVPVKEINVEDEKQIKLGIKKIQEYVQDFRSKCKKIHDEHRWEILPFEFIYLSPQIRFLLDYRIRMLIESQIMRKNIFGYLHEISQEIMGFMVFSMDNKMVVTMNFTLFDQYIEKYLSQQDELRVFNRKMESINTAMQHYIEIIMRPSIISLSSLKFELEKASLLIKSNYDIPPFNAFDTGLISYISSNKLDESIDRIIKECLQSDPLNRDTTQLLRFIIGLSKSFEISTQSTLFVLSASVTRYFFNNLYIKSSVLFYNIEESLVFAQKCQQISRLTPKLLEIPEGLLADADMNLPLSVLFLNNLLLHEIACELESIQFQIAPIDILVIIVKSLKNLELVVKYNQIQLHPDGIPNGEPKRWELMSFDDCFSLFFSVFVMNPPSNASSISTMLDSFQNLDLSMSLQFARTILITTVQQVGTFNIEKSSFF